MLQPLAHQLWHVQHEFSVNHLPISSRMTIARLADGGLWLHSPVPLRPDQREALLQLGPVRFIVAPSKAHHLFLTQCMQAFPDAQVFGAPGLRQKRPDIKALNDLPSPAEAPWAGELQSFVFEGIPAANETVWFHAPSATLIVTDLLQWWQGPLPLPARLYARLTRVRQGLGVPLTVRGLVRDRAAAQRSARQIMQWPFERVVTAHNAVVESHAREDVRRALQHWL
jgi:hypothetical protein